MRGRGAQARITPGEQRKPFCRFKAFTGKLTDPMAALEEDLKLGPNLKLGPFQLMDSCSLKASRIVLQAA